MIKCIDSIWPEKIQKILNFSYKSLENDEKKKIVCGENVYRQMFKYGEWS